MQRKLIFISIIGLVFVSCSSADRIDLQILNYPDGKDFAFTIIEDPDYGNLKQKRIMYEFLDNINLKTTIGVWVLDNTHGSGVDGWQTNTRGVTTTDKQYLNFNKYLQEKGFEICLHTVGPGNDLREETIQGYELFKKHFGHYPKININHADNLENIYWGPDRFSNPILKYLYGFKRGNSYGHLETSQYFWGDIGKEKTKYVRGFATDRLNTLSVNPSMPYHLEDKPYVNYWFGCTDGYDVSKFRRVISDKNIDTLVMEKGVAIIYTHFAFGFIDRSYDIDEIVKRQLFKISKLNGWFVPVSTILDRLQMNRNIKIIKNTDHVFIINNNKETIKGLTISTNQKALYIENNHTWRYSDKEGKMSIGDMHPYSVIQLRKENEINTENINGIYERIIITWEWFVGRFNK